ncbi:hypothetical protein CA223_15700 [Sphingomonas koreensis]|jgi:hypothetical protein|uniref:Uncharacterized protein n=1 Tax=Sphingomonas koreensis TaxID=93064 RepID=A0A1L6JD52_9SPHN|nr:hypothetical protein [Sphingomonas koreensis]APR53881.1 hypothetical protein BRX40_17010 [Sphingomonas koreensis]MDC7808766.1 hypothetical protein [Sphingomonas koreensis]RSU18952.1 hypothetical protein CA224_13735 [Sphingomonas koreensis]RSU24028.1 hypothetical protein CA222_14100 [Sphingomonas koreensis]RSU26280.1 hypothetical protein CA225_13005 [Sphingomonas koreensis]
MIEDREIWACAHQLMRQHGTEAWFHAAQRADELLASGEIEGHRTFLRILDRIKQLEQLEADSRLH